MKSKITVIVNGYNEEARAEIFFRSISMFDEIICTDRSSSDRTRDIAQKYGAKIIKIDDYPVERSYEFYDKISYMIWEKVTNEWVLQLTYADVVHPRLYECLSKVINNEELKSDVIAIPWVEWLFGYQGEHIPYCHYFRHVLKKKNLLLEKFGEIHQEFNLAKHEVYYMEENHIIAVHHMTFYNLHYSFNEQCLRYAVLELRKYGEKGSFLRIIHDIYHSIQSGCKCIRDGFREEGKTYRTFLLAAIMITIYRGIIYYLNVMLLLLDRCKENNRICFLKSLVDGLPKRGEFNKVGIIRMVCKLLFFPIKLGFNLVSNLLLEIISLFFSIINFCCLYIVIIWDQCRKKPVEKFYKELAIDILEDRL